MDQAKNKNLKTILIVDDEKLFLASLKEGMAALADEFIVKTALNGQKAIEKLQSSDIDLVVTDLKMPVMDGFELLARMMSDYPHIPVIVMTAFGTPEIEKIIHDLDAIDYLEKPIDLQLLADKIRSGINRNPDGHIKGIMLFSFLQMLQVEQKTSVLKITSQGRKGTLYFSSGELVDALYGKITGEEAALEIVCWDETEIELVNLSKKFPQHIKKPLQNILMEAARLKDEKLLSHISSHNSSQLHETGKLHASGKLLPQSHETGKSLPQLHASGKPLPQLHASGKSLMEGVSAPYILSTFFDHQRFSLTDGILTPTPEAGIKITIPAESKTFDNLKHPKKENLKPMANNVNESLDELMTVDGAIAVALVDSNSGMALGSTGSGVNLEIAAACNSEVVKSKQKAIQNLGLKDKIEDILISLGQQYHLIRPIVTHPNLFFYMVLNRATSNLAMARFKLSDIESRVEV